MAHAVLRVVLLVLAIAAAAAAQESPPAGLQSHIDALSDFDYPTRMNAARMLRRASPREAVPVLTDAVLGHRDEFVRYRALVLLTGFNDPSTADLMRAVMTDRNDRLREVAFRWFERHPDSTLTPMLMSALNTEQAEFVRPALVRAVAALGDDAQVQRAMLTEVRRGLDFFRSAVIEVLGDHKATYAIDALNELAVLEGPLQDDAVLALGRIGDRRAFISLSTLTDPPLEVVPALQAALCLLEDACQVRLTVLAETAESQVVTLQVSRAALMALGSVAASGNDRATAVLATLGGQAPPGRLRDGAAIAFGTAALRNPRHIIDWIERTPAEQRTMAVELLREGFEFLEEDFAEEQFFATARATYWGAPEASETRTVTAALIDRLDF